MPETEGRGGKLVENGGIAPVVIPLVVAITLNSVTSVLELKVAEWRQKHIERAIFQTFWKLHCCTKSLFQQDWTTLMLDFL